ncbi:hypothetical protein EYF80_016897 [Liparis tanakae]|uniref:Uncharacterized protein n=1 Tax=Liparis tanakae TaxID=230148 RepID=A0A4Z2I4T4_9TELE|nr:hypothetical protein EYF80_016897 [Liparis tanakae]
MQPGPLCSQAPLCSRRTTTGPRNTALTNRPSDGVFSLAVFDFTDVDVSHLGAPRLRLGVHLASAVAFISWSLHNSKGADEERRLRGKRKREKRAAAMNNNEKRQAGLTASRRCMRQSWIQYVRAGHYTCRHVNILSHISPWCLPHVTCIHPKNSDQRHRDESSL